MGNPATAKLDRLFDFSQLTKNRSISAVIGDLIFILIFLSSSELYSINTT